MLLGDADVVVALGEALVELDHAGALAHGGVMPTRRWSCSAMSQSQSPNTWVKLSLGGVAGLTKPTAGSNLPGGVVFDRVGLRQFVARALPRDDVQELRAALLAEVLQRRDQCIQIVAIDGADVVEAEFLKDGAGHDHALGVLFEAPRELVERGVLEHAFGTFARGRVKLPLIKRARYLFSAPTGGLMDMSLSLRMTSRSPIRPPCETPALFSASKAMPAVIEPSPMMATARRSSPLSLAAIAMPCGPEMLVDEWPVPKVSYSLSSRRETADAAELAQRAHAVTPAGEDLVRVGLVAHVPDQAVMGRVNVMQGHRQFDRAEVGAEVPAGLGHRFPQRRRNSSATRRSSVRGSAGADQPGR